MDSAQWVLAQNLPAICHTSDKYTLPSLSHWLSLILKAKRTWLWHAQKISFCPDCGKRFASEVNILQHMNQPSSSCGHLINDSQVHSFNVPIQESGQSPHQLPAVLPKILPDIPFDAFDHQTWQDCFDSHSDSFDPQSSDSPIDPDPPSNVEYYPESSEAFPGGKMFMKDFFSDRYSLLCQDNLFYPFALQEDWQLGSWLLHSGLSMAKIDSFLKLDLVSVCLLPASHLTL